MQREVILKSLQKPLRDKAEQLLNSLGSKNIAIGLTQGLRSLEEQKKTWNKGRDSKGNIVDIKQVVTHAKPGFSFHQYGLAFDVVPIKDGKEWWNAPMSVWKEIGVTGESLGLIWGGRWSGEKMDMPHFEYHPGLSIREVYDYFKKTGQVLIEKTVTPVNMAILTGLVIGVFFSLDILKGA